MQAFISGYFEIVIVTLLSASHFHASAESSTIFSLYLSVALLFFFPLFSFQGTNAEGVPSKLNIVRTRFSRPIERSDLEDIQRFSAVRSP